MERSLKLGNLETPKDTTQISQSVRGREVHTSNDIEAFLDSEEMKLDQLLEKVQKESPDKKKKIK